MKFLNNLLILSLFFFLTFCSPNGQVKPHDGPVIYDVPKTYKIQWDVDPRQRWFELAQIYKPSLQGVIQAIEQYLVLPGWFQSGVEYFADNLYKYKDFVEEIHGISEAAEIPFSYVFLANFAYEVSTACTGIVIRNQFGAIMHGRNLDFPGAKLLSKLSAKVEIYRGDTWVATFDQLVGYVFCLTGQREDKWAVNVDTRMELKEFLQVLANVFYYQKMPSCGLVRENLLNNSIDTYEKAVQSFQQTEISGAIYYIISGQNGNQGTVIERDPSKVNAQYSLDSQKWFLVQTNYDRDRPDKDGRRTAAEKRINEIGPNITAQQLFNQVLVQYPTFNSLTLYTITMINQARYNNITSWYGVNQNQQQKILLEE